MLGRLYADAEAAVLEQLLVSIVVTARHAEAAQRHLAVERVVPGDLRRRVGVGVGVAVLEHLEARRLERRDDVRRRRERRDGLRPGRGVAGSDGRRPRPRRDGPRREGELGSKFTPESHWW